MGESICEIVFRSVTLGTYAWQIGCGRAMPDLCVSGSIRASYVKPALVVDSADSQGRLGDAVERDSRG